jgi:hypothetical protein
MLQELLYFYQKAGTVDLVRKAPTTVQNVQKVALCAFKMLLRQNKLSNFAPDDRNPPFN